MAKNGFQLIDAEMHVMEPVDLWERYIDAEFAGRAPRRLDERRWDIRTIVEGEVTTTDYPHGDSKYPRAMDRFLALPLGEQSKKKILWDNALRLYAL